MRYKIKLLVIIIKFYQGYLILEDLDKDELSINTYIIKKIYYAYAISILALDNFNLLGILINIQYLILINIKQFFYKPKKKNTLDKYIIIVKDSKDILLEIAYKKICKQYNYEGYSGNAY